MRYMIIVKATPETEAETIPVTADPVLLAEMADYHEQLMKAGGLLDGSGLKPSAQGWRIRYDGDTRTVSTAPSPPSRCASARRATCNKWLCRWPQTYRTTRSIP